MINVVLYEPEIPQNTGNIMRTCVAVNAKLHLIEPLGFKLDDKTVKRCGVNYIDKLEYEVYSNFDDFLSKNDGKFYFFTRYGKKPHSDFDFTSNGDRDIYLIFGKESTGIPKEILRGYLDRCMRLPTTSNVRSLNLSNCVAIALYEVLRQFDYLDLLKTEPHKGEDWLLEDQSWGDKMSVSKYIDSNSISEQEFDLIMEIVKLRMDKGLTQKELADMTGISQPNIARFEKNVHSASLSTVLKILNSMGYKLSIEKVKK